MRKLEADQCQGDVEAPSSLSGLIAALLLIPGPELGMRQRAAEACTDHSTAVDALKVTPAITQAGSVAPGRQAGHGRGVASGQHC